MNADELTAADIARLLPASWSFTFTSIERALAFYYPDGIPAA